MPRRTKFQREKDLVVITDRYYRGDLQSEIADDLEITQQMVSKDLKEIQKRWVKHTTRNLGIAKAEELAKIDRRELEYLRMYDASRDSRVETFKDASGVTRTVVIPRQAKHPFGNPEYLEGMRKCSMDRRSLLGLDAAKGIEVTHLDWRTEAIALIKEGKLTYEGLREEIGADLAEELFVTSGVAITKQ